MKTKTKTATTATATTAPHENENENEKTATTAPHENENENSLHNRNSYKVPHENENENNCLSYRMKTKMKTTTIAVSVTAAPYENENKNSHHYLVLQYIVAVPILQSLLSRFGTLWVIPNVAVALVKCYVRRFLSKSEHRVSE